MLRAILVAVGAMTAGLLVFAAAVAEPRTAEGELHRVELTLARPDGSLAMVSFEVLAPDRSSAAAAAQRALIGVAPESVVLSVPTDSVAAQWLPWSWKWDNAEIPVKVAYNPTGAPPGAGPGVVTAGLGAWSAVPTSSFRFQYAGVTDNTATVAEFGPDGENVISWQSLDCSVSCVLGVTSKDPVAHEVDMLLNSNPAAAEQLGVGTKVDWRTVVLHELGHMAGLEHSCPVPFGPCTAAEGEAVMFYQYRGILRTLAPDDIAGISALYPVSNSASPTPGSGPTTTPTPYPEYPVFIEKGWNLLVLPELSIEALSNGLPCVVAVYSYEGEAWRSWIRGAPPAIQEVSEVGPQRAYWLLSTASCGQDFP